MNAVLPKLVIFDLDGTLIEFPRNYIFVETERILREFGLPPVPRDVLDEHFCAFDFFRFYESADREDFIVRFWKAFNWAGYPKPVPFSWTASTLAALAGRGIAMAIATARLDPEPAIRADLAHTGWLHHFASLRARPSEHVHWTDKTGQIVETCRALGIAAEETMLAGDVPTDITSARAVGIGHSVAVLSGGIRRDVLENSRPDFLLNGIHELTQLLKNG